MRLFPDHRPVRERVFNKNPLFCWLHTRRARQTETNGASNPRTLVLNMGPKGLTSVRVHPPNVQPTSNCHHYMRYSRPCFARVLIAMRCISKKPSNFDKIKVTNSGDKSLLRHIVAAGILLARNFQLASASFSPAQTLRQNTVVHT